MAERKGKAGGRKRRRKGAVSAHPLSPREVAAGGKPERIAQAERDVEACGGQVLAAYREPYGGHWVLLAALPIDEIEATPFQRKLSDTHVRRLVTVISKVGSYLDPVIAVPRAGSPDGGPRYWTPNGHHRLSAMRELDAKSIVALVMPQADLAYKILALNTEKAHNLRERSLEVSRMYRELAAVGELSEEDCALEFEEAALVTLGFCYESRPRFSGGAYHPILRRVDRFLKRPLRAALPVRESRARRLLELDDIVIARVEALKARGLTSPYLKSFVVARVNPLRFRPKEAEPLDFDATLERMIRAASRFNPEKIKPEEIARSGGAIEAEAAE